MSQAEEAERRDGTRTNKNGGPAIAGTAIFENLLDQR